MSVLLGQGIKTGDARTSKVVKVRLDASGRRIVGYVVLGTGEHRISDRLNNADPFFFVQPDGTGDDKIRQRAIHKDAVSYVAALEEPERPGALLARGSFYQVTVELIRPATTLVGELFVPYGSTIAAVLNDSRRFVNLRNVSFGDGPETFEYLALAKNQSRLWEVLAECEPSSAVR